MSKQIELTRALSASSRSTLLSLSHNDVLFQDEWIIAINKPCGVYCESVLASIHRLLNEPFASDPLEAQVSQTKLHLANRLDRDTSGVMLITKSPKVTAKMVKEFSNHKVIKIYVALCVGSTPKWEKITVKSGHGRSMFGAWRVYAATDVGRSLPGGSVIKDMQTRFEVLSVNGQATREEVSQVSKDERNVLVVEEMACASGGEKKNEILIRAFPRSGRTHQIRLHCQYLGIPVRGDVKYDGINEWTGKTFDGHELHAESLSIEHPITGIPLVFQAPLPLWASQVMQLL